MRHEELRRYVHSYIHTHTHTPTHRERGTPGGHPARDEQSDVVGRKREVVNNTAKQRERSDSVSCKNMRK